MAAIVEKAKANQIVTDRYALYLGDCCEVLPKLPADSVGFSVFSPPFADLYSYSGLPKDMANCRDYEQFFEHFGFLVGELHRLLMPGRVVAVHCMDLPTYKRSGEEIGLRDFPGGLIRCFGDAGFVFHSRFTVWKDPLVAATRTKAIGLAHKQIVKDSSLCRTGIADYVLAFRKKGENPRPVRHPRGLREYHGSRPVPRELDRYLRADGDNPYDAQRDKRSHWIWQQYASPVWFDIRQTRTMQYKQAREHDDDKHICPLQLDVIERCVELWSTEGDVVLTPFMGIGSEVYVAVKNGRKGVGVELKPSYFRQAARNLHLLEREKEGGLFGNVED